MKKMINGISQEYINKICRLYGDYYDDRIEDSRPPSAGKKDGIADLRRPGTDWYPGMPAGHKSLGAFQRELRDEHGIRLSTSKLRKLLISGGVWTTERSREVQSLFFSLTNQDQDADKAAMTEEEAVLEISRILEISTVTVIVNLPYLKCVNRLENRSKNAVRCDRYRRKKAESTGMNG